MGFFYKMSKYQMSMYEIREVMAVFGFVQSFANCAEFCDKLVGPNLIFQYNSQRLY